jgi:hypothetical protein
MSKECRVLGTYGVYVVRVDTGGCRGGVANVLERAAH